MTTHQSLYEITGNISDYNTILINRGELRRLIQLQQEMIDTLKIAEQFMLIASDCNLDEVEIGVDWFATHELIADIRNMISKGESK